MADRGHGSAVWCNLREMVVSEPKILVTLPDGQVVRCGVVNLLEDGGAARPRTRGRDRLPGKIEHYGESATGRLTVLCHGRSL